MRTLSEALIPVLWAIWLVVWIVAARGVKKARRREDLRSRLSHQIPLVAGALLIAVHNIFGGALEGYFVPHTETWRWIGVALAALGIGFAVAARLWLGGNWSSIVTLKQDHELIRSGPYAWVRHPIYSGLSLALLGTAISIGKWRALIGFALVVAAFVRKLTIEEHFMREQFGEAYMRYRSDVPALLPFLF